MARARARRWIWWTAIGILLGTLAGVAAWRLRLALPDQLRRIETALRDEAGRYGIGISWRTMRFQPFYLNIAFEDVTLSDRIANLPLGSARRVDVSLSPRLLLFGESPVSRIRVSNYTFRFGEADRPVLDRVRAAPSGGGTLPDILLFDGIVSLGPFGKVEQVRMRLPSVRIRNVRFFGTRVTFAVDNAMAAVDYPVVGGGAWPFPSFSGDLFVKDNVVNLRRFRADGPAASLKASGHLDLAGGRNDLKASGSVDMARWIALDAPGARLAGRVVREGKGEFSASLKGSLSEPGGNARMTFRNGRFEGIEAADFELAVALAGRQLRVDSLKGTIWRGALSGSGGWDLAKKKGTATASLSRAHLESMPWPSAADGWRPTGLGDVTVTSSGDRNAVSGSMVLASPEGIERSLPDGGRERIRLPLGFTAAGKVFPGSRKAEIDSSHLQFGEHGLTVSGAVDWGNRRLSLSGAVTSPSGRAADFGIRESVAWRQLTGGFGLEGGFDSPSVTAHVTAESLGVRAFPPIPFSAKAEGILTDLIYFVADVPADITKATITGTVTAPLARRPIQVDASVSAREIDFSGVPKWLASASASMPGFDSAGAARYLETLAGHGGADLQFAYSTAETTVAGAIRSNEISLRGVPVRGVNVDGNWKSDAAGGRWQANGVGEIAGGRVRLSGSGDGARGDFSGTAERIDMARASALIPGRKVQGIRGTASAAFSAKLLPGGSIEIPDIHLSVSDLVAAGVAWGGLTGEGNLGAEAGTFRLASGSPAIRLSGGISRGKGMPVSFSMSGSRVPTSLFTAMAGKGSLPAEGKWDIEADGRLFAAGLIDGTSTVAASLSDLHFRLSGISPSISDVSFESLTAEGRKKGEALSGEIRTTAPDGNLSFTLGLGEGHPFHTEGPFSFGNRKSDGADDTRNRFSMSGKVELAGSLAAIEKTSGSLQVDQFRYKGGGIDLSGKALSARLGADGIRWAGGTVIASGHPISVAGKVSWKGDLDARVEGRLPLAMVRIVTDVFDRLDGTMTMNLRVTGKLDNPSIVGTGHLDGGVFSFKGYAQLFEGMKADAIISRGKIVIEHFEGRSGGGYLDGHGELPLQFDAGQRMFFSVDFLDMRYPYPDEFRPVIQGHAELFGPVENLLVTGDVEIQSARYTRTIRPQKLMLDFKRRLADVTARRQKDDFRVRLDINVVSAGTLEIHNNMAKATAKGEFKVSGDTSRVVVLGAFDVIEGKIEFQGDVYDVKHLSLDFNDPRRNNPRIDGRAETKKNNYLVTVLVTGTLDKYEIDFVSDPPLSKNDIVSLLSLGVTSQSLAGQEGTVGASVGASLALGPYKGRVEEGIRNLVGLDKLAVEAAFSSATKSFEPRFIAGKTFGERLTVSVSTLVGATSDSSASAEFKLLENVFLIGSWQSATTQKTGDLGADIKFKYRYRTFNDFLGGGD